MEFLFGIMSIYTSMRVARLLAAIWPRRLTYVCRADAEKTKSECKECGEQVFAGRAALGRTRKLTQLTIGG